MPRQAATIESLAMAFEFVKLATRLTACDETHAKYILEQGQHRQFPDQLTGALSSPADSATRWRIRPISFTWRIARCTVRMVSSICSFAVAVALAWQCGHSVSPS